MLCVLGLLLKCCINRRTCMGLCSVYCGNIVLVILAWFTLEMLYVLCARFTVEMLYQLVWAYARFTVEILYRLVWDLL